MTRRALAALGERDGNHAEITAAYRAHWCNVLDLSKAGGGCGDLLVKIPTRKGGILQLVEVKTAEGVLSPSQKRFHAEWGYGVITIIRNVESVAAHVKGVQERFR